MARYKNIDRETRMLFPEDMSKWVAEDSIVHFIIEAVEAVGEAGYHENPKGSGNEQFPPEMMTELLIYSYATGKFSSYEIEKATYNDVPARYICANTHPDHNTVNNFRNSNKEAFKNVFTKVLVLAQNTGIMKKIGTVSVDGTKMHANAGKHKAVSYKYAKEAISRTEKEIEELIEKAEESDNTQNEVDIPGEIAFRKRRKAVLKDAVTQMEEMYKEVYEQEKKAYDEKIKEQDEEEKKNGKKKRGKKPKEPAPDVPDTNQLNFTDKESRIMKYGNTDEFEQCYNLQAVVDTDSMLIVGKYATQKANDRQEIKNGIESVCKEAEQEEKLKVCADTGYFNAPLIDETEKEHPEVKIYCAVKREKHGKTPEKLFIKLPEKEPEENREEAMTAQKMLVRLKTVPGQEIYNRRKITVEPVFGIIKRVMKFRQFLTRGLDNISNEWNLVTLAYNFRRLFGLRNLRLAAA